MKDKYNIDGHKLAHHIPRVNDWLKGKNIYPIYMELSPVRQCNHRCTFCGVDFMEYKTKILDAAVLKERLTELGELGLKSAMYAGEGEPFLHPNFADILAHTKQSGIDAAITTNGSLMKKEVTDKILENVEWIKTSVDAGSKETYAKIHRCKPNTFDTVIKNAAYAAELASKNNYSCTLGMQSLLLPENTHEMSRLARIARDIGMKYLVVKPYSQHPQGIQRQYENVEYKKFLYLEEELAQYNDENFEVIFRVNTMKKWDKKEKSYVNCLALPYWSYICADGDVWGCSIYLKDKRFLYGNIYENKFQDIWESAQRLKSLRWVEKDLDISVCRTNCRMDEINRYLWELKNPVEHVNFI
jgi:GTP 3',8-cyclase